MKATIYISAIAVFLVCCDRDSKINEANQKPVISNDTIAVMDTLNNAHEYTEEDYKSMQIKAEDEGRPFTFAGLVDLSPVAGVDMTKITSQAYLPDILITGEGSSDAEVEYHLTNIQRIEGNFSNVDGTCKQQTFLIYTREDVSGETYYDLFLIENINNEVQATRLKTFDGSYAETFVDVKFDLNDGLSNCLVLAVSSELHSDEVEVEQKKSLTFFALNGSDAEELLDLPLENLLKANGKSVKETTRTFQITNEKQNGFSNVIAHVIIKVKDEILSEGDETYRFNGTRYVKK